MNNYIDKVKVMEPIIDRLSLGLIGIGDNQVVPVRVKNILSTSTPYSIQNDANDIISKEGYLPHVISQEEIDLIDRLDKLIIRTGNIFNNYIRLRKSYDKLGLLGVRQTHITDCVEKDNIDNKSLEEGLILGSTEYEKDKLRRDVYSDIICLKNLADCLLELKAIYSVDNLNDPFRISYTTEYLELIRDIKNHLEEHIKLLNQRGSYKATLHFQRKLYKAMGIIHTSNILTYARTLTDKLNGNQC